MTRYIPVDKPCRGGVYWYQLTEFPERPFLLVRVMDLHKDRVEIIFVASSATNLWVNKNLLWTREDAG